MAVILAFPYKQPPGADQSRHSTGGSAQILFFTGVRYERHVPMAQESLARDPSGPVSGPMAGGGNGSVPTPRRRRRG